MVDAGLPTAYRLSKRSGSIRTRPWSKAVSASAASPRLRNTASMIANGGSTRGYQARCSWRVTSHGAAADRPLSV